MKLILNWWEETNLIVIINRENESSDGNSDIVLSERNRKIRIIDSE